MISLAISKPAVWVAGAAGLLSAIAACPGQARDLDYTLKCRFDVDSDGVAVVGTDRLFWLHEESPAPEDHYCWVNSARDAMECFTRSQVNAGATVYDMSYKDMSPWVPRTRIVVFENGSSVLVRSAPDREPGVEPTSTSGDQVSLLIGQCEEV